MSPVMVCITKILRKDGLYSYRVRIPLPSGKRFSVTFNSLTEAKNWIAENENNLQEIPLPKKYREWPYTGKKRKR